MKKILIIILLHSGILHAQQDQDTSPNTKEIVFLAGTIQPILLQGGNIEIDCYLPKMVFNYSHGFSLEMEQKTGTAVGELKRQGIALHIPYSTGFGIGYRLNRYFDLRVEPKLHQFEAYYDGTDRKNTSNQIGSYQTITLGVGSYFRWKPFEKSDDFVRGFFTSTSIRYWPKVWSSNYEIQYFNMQTKQQELLKTPNIGFANTPFLFNVAIGYSITF